MRVAVDAMGGDHAPHEIVGGALEIASELGIDIILVGNRWKISECLGSRSSIDRIDVHHCEEAIQMDESPLYAVRKKKDSSIRVAFELAKNGKADAVVSAGNSGATLTAGVITLGRIKGVDRPAIAGILPGENGPVILIDVGANVDCQPEYLLQFGIMAQAFGISCLNMNNPKVGLLSIGEEGEKGNEQVKSARELFNDSQLNFVGNVEGRDIFKGDVEIVVCDGFVGNVVLKLSEGIMESSSRVLKKEFKRSFFGRMALKIGSRSLTAFDRKYDYEEYGGAPLLGINGVGVVCHGGSSARAIKNAIKLSAQYIQNKVLEKMIYQIQHHHGMGRLVSVP